MAISYKWKIEYLDVRLQKESMQNVVSAVHWRLEATDDTDGIKSEIYSISELPSPLPDGFIEFEAITEEQIIQWLESTFISTIEIPNLEDPDQQPTIRTIDGLEDLKESLEKEILEKRTPKMVTRIPPWQQD